MHIAKKKRKENIVEYVLYMFQVQDTIRALGLNTGNIKANLLPGYKDSPFSIEEIEGWYLGLVEQMRKEGKEEIGNLQSLQNIINEVNELHLWLLNNAEYQNYKSQFETVKPILMEYHSKVKLSFSNEIELAFQMLYNFILLKMKKHKITKETELAVKTVSTFLKELAFNYKRYESGEISIA